MDYNEKNEIKYDEEYPLSDQMMEEFKNLDIIVEKQKKEYLYRKLYSNFSNFPICIKKNIIINLAIIFSIILTFIIFLTKLNYFSILFLIVCVLLIFFLGFRCIYTISVLKNVNFVEFTGKVIESYPVGSKITKDFHFIVKLLSDDGKTLCFRYFRKETLMFDQYVTIYMNENEKISASNYGPMIENYIEAIPTDELNSKFKFTDLENGTSEISAEEYINKSV